MPADIESIAREASSAGLFIDFDGTLSHIVDLPSDARPAPGALEVLTLLAKNLALVAIVSGRAPAELVERLGEELEIWGVHGAARAHRGRVTVADEVRRFVPVLQEARAEAKAALADPTFEGCLVEDKTVALALHYRMATHADAGDRLRQLADALAASYGLLRTDARMAYELRPPVEITKGSVVLARVRELSLSAAVFIGDDVVDLVAFDALDRLEEEGLSVLRIAVASGEAPAALLERADLEVEGVDGAVGWLSELARRLAQA